MKFELLFNVIEKPISGEWGDEGDGVNVIRTTNFTNEGRLNLKEIVKRNISRDLINQKKLNKGDIIIEKSGGSPSQPVGRVIYFDLDGEYLCNNFTSILRAKKDLINSRYLLYILFASHKFGKTLSYQNKTTGIINLQLKRYIEEIEIPLPSLSTQKIIAEILDTADSLRQKDKALIDKYNQLSQSLFLDMFGNLKGVKKSLSEICNVNPKKSEISNLDKNTTVSFIPMASVSSQGKIDLSQSKPIDDVWSGFTYFKENDVVFAKITPCMENGKGAIMKDLMNGIGFGTTEFHVLRPIKNLSTATWIYHLTMMPFFRNEAEKNMTGSAGQRRVPTDFFDNYKLVVPEIKMQNQFALLIEQIEKQKQLAEESLKQSEAIFQSLLQKSFTGELLRHEAETKTSKKQLILA